MNDGISFLPCLEQEESTCPGRTRIPSSILQLSFPLSIGRVSRAPVLLAQMHIQTQKAHVLVSLIRSCHHNAASVTSKFPKRDVCSDSRLLKASQQPFLVACARRLLFFFFFFLLCLCFGRTNTFSTLKPFPGVYLQCVAPMFNHLFARVPSSRSLV